MSDKDAATLLIDSTAVRVQQHGAGALKKEEENKLDNEGTERSGGGLTTKIHLSTDAKGRIQQLVQTGGQTADVKMFLYCNTELKAG